MKTSGTESASSSEKKPETAEDFLSFLTDEIHTVIAASTDDDGLPVTCAIDIMDSDENSLYFLTAKGKGFYRRLIKHPFISLTGVWGKDTMSSTAVSVRGYVEETGDTVLARLLEKNPYMLEIYPTEESRKALSAFRLYEGSGEFFDLSSKPIVRKKFSFDSTQSVREEFFITDRCTGCGKCLASCSQQCIDSSALPFCIHNENCLMCGMCSEVCTGKAVIRRKTS